MVGKTMARKGGLRSGGRTGDAWSSSTRGAEPVGTSSVRGRQSAASAKPTRHASRPQVDLTDYARIDRLTDDDIGRAIASDPDAMELDDDWFATAEFVLPERKQQTTLRLDTDVLAFFRAQGPGYQTRINAILRRYVVAQRRKTG